MSRSEGWGRSLSWLCTCWLFFCVFLWLNGVLFCFVFWLQSEPPLPSHRELVLSHLLICWQGNRPKSDTVGCLPNGLPTSMSFLIEGPWSCQTFKPRSPGSQGRCPHPLSLVVQAKTANPFLLSYHRWPCCLLWVSEIKEKFTGRFWKNSSSLIKDRGRERESVCPTPTSCFGKLSGHWFSSYWIHH